LEGKAKITQDKKKILQMLFSVVLLFAFSWLPYIINKMLNIFPPTKHFKSPDLFVCVGNFLGLLNSVANPIVYAALNKNFRTAFKHAIRCHCSYEKEERRRRSVISLRNSSQAQSQRKRTMSNSSRITGLTETKRKNSMFSGSIVDQWASGTGQEPQVRCLSFTSSNNDETIPRSNVPRRSSCSNGQRKVSFGPEIIQDDLALEQLQMFAKENRRGSSTALKNRSSTLSSLGPIMENCNWYDTEDSNLNEGFEFSG